MAAQNNTLEISSIKGSRPKEVLLVLFLECRSADGMFDKVLMILYIEANVNFNFDKMLRKRLLSFLD